jgi:hypothetical protein
MDTGPSRQAMLESPMASSIDTLRGRSLQPFNTILMDA